MQKAQLHVYNFQMQKLKQYENVNMYLWKIQINTVIVPIKNDLEELTNNSKAWL